MLGKVWDVIRDMAREWRELLWRQYRRVCWLLIKAVKLRVTFRCRHGRLTCFTHDESMAPYLFIKGEYEYSFSLRCLSFLKERHYISDGKDVVLYDVGANNGLIGLGLVNAGVVNRVVAFEPEPGNYELLLRNIALNRRTQQILPHHMALSDRKGFLDMELATDNVGDHRIRLGTTLVEAELAEDQRSVIQVPVETLDDLLGEDVAHQVKMSVPDVLWVDVQGHEGYVFKGAASVLQEHCLPVVLEICPYAVLRAGMNMDEYTMILQKYWNSYWVERKRGFVCYPMSEIYSFINELGIGEQCYENVILTHEKDGVHRD